MPPIEPGNTAEATAPKTLTLKEGVASLLQGDKDRASDTRRHRQEPEADVDETPAAQADEADLGDTADEATDREDDEGEPLDEQEPDEQQAEEPVYTVRVDGKDIEVTLSELTKGYSRQADYTRRAQALAEQRRAAEEVQTRATVERDQYRQALEIIHRSLTEGVQEPDWATLERTDPIEFLRQKELFRERREKAGQLQQEHARVLEQQQAEEATRFNGYLNSQKTALLEKIPLWRDPAKAAGERKALREYATKTLGYTSEEIAQAFDHRLIVMLRKSWLYDRVSSKGALADKRVRNAPAEIPSRGLASGEGRKPGQVARAKQMRQLEKSGDIRDAVSLLLME